MALEKELRREGKKAEQTAKHMTKRLLLNLANIIRFQHSFHTEFSFEKHPSQSSELCCHFIFAKDQKKKTAEFKPNISSLTHSAQPLCAAPPQTSRKDLKLFYLPLHYQQ